MKRGEYRGLSLEQLKSDLAAADKLREKPVKNYESRPVSEEMRAADPDNFVKVGHTAWALRCSAQSKRAKRRCSNAALKGMTVCKWHGGRCRGPTTGEGLAKCAQVRTTHGRSTGQSRRDSKALHARIRVLSKAVDSLIASGTLPWQQKG